MPSTRSALSCLAAVAAITFTACGNNERELADRQDVVADAGAEVMPFNLDATTHVFTDNATGGVQDVVADDPTDTTNIDLIRRHLEDEAAKFRAGDFSDPEAIHGAAMPGLSVLKEQFDEIAVEFAETDTGARITYSTEGSDVVRAIHDWFAAQSGDHGQHAEHASS